MTPFCKTQKFDLKMELKQINIHLIIESKYRMTVMIYSIIRFGLGCAVCHCLIFRTFASVSPIRIIINAHFYINQSPD